MAKWVKWIQDMPGEKCLHHSARHAVNMSQTRQPRFNTGNYGFPTATMRPGIAALTIAVLAVSMCAQTASSDQSADLKPSKSTPLVRHWSSLRKKGVIHVTMSAEIPDNSQREKLMPFVGSYVEITGEMFHDRG